MGFKFKFRHIFTLSKRSCHFHSESESILQCRNVFYPRAKLISVCLFLKLSRFDRMNRANKKNALKLKSLVLSLCNNKINNSKIVDQKCNFFNQYDFLCVYELDQSFTILNEPTQLQWTTYDPSPNCCHL